MSGALLDFLQELPVCSLLKKRMCHPYLPLEFLPGRGEERKKQWGPGREGYLRQGNGTLPEERPGPGPSWLTCRHQLGLRAVAGVTPRPFLWALKSLYIFRCFIWEGWKKFRSSWPGGSAHVYSEMPRHGPPALKLGRSLRGVCWLHGRRFPTSDQLQNCLPLEQVS